MPFVNTEYFREDAIYFEKYGRYPDGDYGTYEWYEYWLERHRRVTQGYEIGGCKITGMHYLYLNFLPIRLVKDKIASTDFSLNKRKATRGEGFPSFWDEDVIMFYGWDIARNGITIPELDKLEQFTGHIPIVRTPENLGGGKNHLWLKPRGVGAPQPNSEIVITPVGEKKIGDLVIGDKVIARDGTVTEVSEIHEKGNLDVYEIEFSDGRKAKCGLNHTWTVIMYNGRKYDFTVKQLLDKGLFRKDNGQTRWYLPEIEPVQFEEKKFEIHPYLMGCLINLKVIPENTFLLFKHKKERDYCEKIIKEYYGESLPYKLSEIEYANGKIEYKIGFKYSNPIKTKLREYGFQGSDDFIKLPEEYKFCSIDQRKDLIRGLLTNKARFANDKYIHVGFYSKKLTLDIQYVIRSLGYNVQVLKETVKSIYKFTIGFAQKECLFLDEHRQLVYNNRSHQRTNANRVGILSIKKLNYKTPMRCIGVPHHEHLYLTTNFIPTHNSWKGGVIPIHRQFFGESNSTFLVADSDEYLVKDGLWTKYISYKDALNGIGVYGDGRNKDLVHGFSRNFIVQDSKKKIYTIGVKEFDSQNKLIETGRKTTVYGVILEGNADKIRGKRGTLIFEEFGSFKEVAKAWQIARESIEEDGNVFDNMFGFGTGGDDGANIADLTKMHADPKTYNILEFYNEWDRKFVERTCAYFTPAYKSLSFKDKDGNSDIEKGKLFFDAKREVYANSTDPQELSRHKAEKPYTPAEALSQSYSNIFPTEELNDHLFQLRAGKIVDKIVTNGIIKETGTDTVEFIPKPELKRFDNYPIVMGGDKTGCVCVMHKPYLINGKVPKNMYRIGVDPYRHDSSTGNSIGAVYVMENPNKLTYYKGDKIVAWYTARPEKQDEFNFNLFGLAKMYGCRIAPENDEPGDIVGYAKRKKLIKYLEDEFELAYDSRIATKKKTSGKYGMHIASGKDNLRKLQGDKYIQEWLMRIRGYDSEGNPIRNLHTILDIGLLLELIQYLDGKNADRIAALRICMYYEQEFLYQNRKISTENRNFGQFFNKKLFA